MELRDIPCVHGAGFQGLVGGEVGWIIVFISGAGASS